MNFQLFFLFDSSPPKSVLEISLIWSKDKLSKSTHSAALRRSSSSSIKSSTFSGVSVRKQNTVEIDWDDEVNITPEELLESKWNTNKVGSWRLDVEKKYI